MRKFEQWTFDNSYSRLPAEFYTRQQATALQQPQLISLNREVATLLELDPGEATNPAMLSCFAGDRCPPGMAPLAMKYTGHQFGVYNPALGDGRGLLLGEVTTSLGDKWDLHLKGSGQTPYSRQGDGRAVLRSSIREYLCGEAMAGLGIPTTRTLCLVGSQEPVWRETLETAATLVRVSPSHVRFGNFEYLFYTQQHQHLKTLADYVIEQHYPELSGQPQPYLALFDKIVTTTATLIAQWQTVGFAHGVMNTDNMSILGLTFDYGPYGFQDDFHSGYICNHSDHSGRYAFDQQPQIALWNLSALGQSLTPLVEPEALNASLRQYQPILREHYLGTMRRKLGLTREENKDGQLINQLFGLLEGSHPDYTLFFRQLADFLPGGDNAPLRDMFIDRTAFDDWADHYQQRLARENSDDQQRRQAMNRVNPKYILRNYLAQQAIEQALAGEYGELERLLNVLRHPFDEQPGMSAYATPPPQWGKSLEISCSS